MKKYLVVEEGWEYNDEYFHQGETEGYNISSKLFSSKEEAEELAEKKNKRVDKMDDFVDYDGERIRPFKVVAVEEDELDIDETEDPVTGAQNLISEYTKRKDELTKLLQKKLPLMLKPVFDQYEDVDTIGWRQYTPYFMDGDTCEFGVYMDDLYINGEYQDSLYLVKEYMKNGKYKTKLEEYNVDIDLSKAAIAFQEVLRTIPEDFFKDIFGDHVTVTINRKGKVKTEHCEHD